MVSVIIPTYNGATKVPNLLRALARQSEKPKEVIVVIDGSKDNTLEVLEPFNTIFKSFIIVQQQNLGRSASRNAGVKKSSGEILIFYDDDMEPNSQSIERHMAFHKAFEGLLSGNPTETQEKLKTDIQNYKAALVSKWVDKYHQGLNKLNTSNLFFTAANCSLKRIDFFKLNGFDEHLTDVEDYDLAFRAIKEGISVYFDKTNTALHHDYITCRSYIIRLREYSTAHEKLSVKYERKDRPRPVLIKRIAYCFFAFPFLVRLIDEDKLRFIPQSLRYKIYSIVIHALSSEFPNVIL